jgi:hypothetical protein
VDRAGLRLAVPAGAAGGGGRRGTLYATNTHLPHKTAATIAAILPWALALLGFFLLLAMLRHARLRRAHSRRATSAAAVAQEPDTIPGAVPSVLGAVPAAAATHEHPAVADEDWPDGEVRSPGQAAELAATGYQGDILVAGRPPADGPGAGEMAAGEPQMVTGADDRTPAVRAGAAQAGSDGRHRAPADTARPAWARTG